MTYQKSSANKSARKYDMKASRRLLIPSIAPMLLILVAVYVLAPILDFIDLPVNMTAEKMYAVMLTAFDGDTLTYIDFSTFTVQAFLILLGLLNALRAFSYMFTKKTVNIYYSSPVDRRTMFSNRIISAVLLSSAGAALPILIDVIINIHFLGNAGYMFYGGFFLFLITEAYFLVGFAIGTFAAAISHTILQWFLSAPALLTLPSGLILLVNSFCNIYLRGYNHMVTYSYLNYHGGYSENILYYQASFLNPLIFGRRLGGSSNTESIMTFFCRRASADTDSNSLTSHLDIYSDSASNFGREMLTSDYIIPVVMWIGITIAALLAARWLCINRRVEKSGILGSSMLSAHLFTTTLAVHTICYIFSFANVSIFAADSSDTAKFAIILSCIPLIFLCYYLLMALFGRSFKQKPKFLIAPAGISAVMLVLAVMLSTGLFGYSTYAPEVNDIEYAVVSASSADITARDPDLYFNYCEFVFSKDSYNENYSVDTIGVFTDEKDLEILTDACRSAAKKSDDMIDASVNVYYKLKNGKEIHRAFSKTDKEAFMKVLNLRETDTYRQELEYLLGNTSKDSITKRVKDDSVINLCFEYSNEQETFNSIVLSKAKILSDSCMTLTTIENTNALREALYKDLTSISLTERKGIEEKPLGVLTFEYMPPDDYETDYYYTDTTDIAIEDNTSYIIYPYMTNVINYLKSTGEYKAFTDNYLTENAISVTTLEAERLLDNQNKYSFYNIVDKENVDYSFNQLVEYVYDGDDEQEYIDDEDYLSCDKLFTGGTTVTDKSEMEKLISGSTFYGNAKGKTLVLIKCKDESIIRLLSE